MANVSVVVPDRPVLASSVQAVGGFVGAGLARRYAVHLGGRLAAGTAVGQGVLDQRPEGLGVAYLRAGLAQQAGIGRSVAAGQTGRFRASNAVMDMIVCSSSYGSS
jgi:hypothetical protein